MKLQLLLIQILFSGFIFCQQHGYVNKISAAKGDTIKFYISTSVSPFNLSIFKIREEAAYLTEFSNITGGIQPLPDSAWEGCNWNETFRFVIPNNWEPGVYRAEFPTGEGERGILFNVKENSLSSYSKILLILSTNTWQAYNNYGGKSIYEFNSTNSERAHKVSFQRPFEDPLGSGDFYRYDARFIQWAAQNNIKHEIVSQLDVHTNPDLLPNYDVVFIAGHNEYWTRKERHAFQNYVADGGKLLILSGNTSWWQIRLEDDGNTLVCYKDKNLDPLTGVVDSLVTVHWWDDPVYYPETMLTGVSFKYGGFVNTFFNGQVVLPSSQGYGDFIAYNTHSWIFKETNLVEGDEFGFENSIVGYETDGAIYDWYYGRPASIGLGGTPLNFRILGFSPAVNYLTSVGITHATMGYYHTGNKGFVFNAATTDWVDGLIGGDPYTDIITKNVLNKSLENRFPPEIINWEPFFIFPAIRNNDSVYINRRNFLVKPGNSIRLNFLSKDPYNRQQNFFFAYNDNIVSNDSVYTFVNNEFGAEPKHYLITGNAYNLEDTASVDYNIFNYEVVIYSKPINQIKPGDFFIYKLKVFNYFGDQLQYSLLNSPGWLFIDQNGILSGTAPSDTGNFAVEIKVENQRNQFDTQSFNLKVTNFITDAEENKIFPAVFGLEQNYPNPFNPQTTISFSLREKAYVSLKVFDVLGNEVAEIFSGEKPEGKHQFIFDARKFNKDLSSGIYFYRLSADGITMERKMILIK